MSLIFDNYKFNEKYNFKNPDNNNSYQDLKNYEKQRRRIIENSLNGITDNINYSSHSPFITKNKSYNEYSNPNSPYVNKKDKSENNSYK